MPSVKGAAVPLPPDIDRVTSTYNLRYSTLQVSEAFAHVLAKRFATAQLRTSLYMHR
jgi:hypothetical protein